ncbi:conserved hypothetical protein [Vibrio phage 142E35-1]|nr:conserved hypothetical protein [Vibrio phage 142E35-1]
MKTFETEKHNIPEGATHYWNETSSGFFAWWDDVNKLMLCPDGHGVWVDIKDTSGDLMKSIPQQEIEWKNGLPPVGSKVMSSYTKTDCDGWCDMHGPSDVIAYHGDYVWIAHHGKFNRVHELCNIEFEKPESPDEKERLEAAYDLYCHVQTAMNKPCSNYDWFLKKGDGNQLDKYLAIVDKTGYRKPD